MKNKFNFFLSALLVLLFIISLNTFSYASSDLSIVDEDFFQDLIDYYTENSANYSGASTFIPFLDTSDLLLYFNNEKDNFETYLDSIGASNKNLIVFITSVSGSRFMISFIPTNNTIGNLEYLQCKYYNSDSIRMSTNYNSLNLKISYTGKYTVSLDNISNYKFSGSVDNPVFYAKTSSFNFTDTHTYMPCFYGINAEPLNIIRYMSNNDTVYKNYFLNDYTNITGEIQNPDNPDGNPENNPGGETPEGNFVYDDTSCITSFIVKIITVFGA